MNEECSLPATKPQNANAAFLADVRNRTSYRTTRILHDTIGSIGLIAGVGLALFLCATAQSVAGGFLGLAIGVACIIGILIEQWLFTLIVDAVDVMIDESRRKFEDR